VLEGGGKVVQETRLYDPDKGETRSMRSKEEANDYRYFPDPDLLPVELDAAFIASVQATLPELPDQKAARFVGHAGPVGIRRRRAHVVEGARRVLRGSRQTTGGGKEPPRSRPSSPPTGWPVRSRPRSTSTTSRSREPHRREAARGLLARIADNTISGKIAKDVFEAMWAEGKDADAIIESKGLKQITDTGAIEKAIDEVMAKNPGQLADYRSGKDKLFGFFVGQVMKATGGKANPAQLNELLKKKLAG
jgi:aspartyl-tRNA(Asn)/glutamyl-tRNA(Gln) amidotransferase subunit B